MLLADVNVFVYAHRPESPRHGEHRAWLDAALNGDEPFGVSEAVLATFVRITTHRRIFLQPSTPDQALAACTAARTGSACVPVRSGPRHWALFDGLCRTVGARGNDVPDAYLAALAIEHGATWITTDRGFARFPGLRWRLPLD